VKAETSGPHCDRYVGKKRGSMVQNPRRPGSQATRWPRYKLSDLVGEMRAGVSPVAEPEAAHVLVPAQRGRKPGGLDADSSLC